MKRGMAFLVAVAAFVASATVTGADMPIPRPTMDQWQIPWRGSHPRAPAVGPRGVVWFADRRGDYLATLDPQTGEFQRIELGSGASPRDLAVVPDGTL